MRQIGAGVAALRKRRGWSQRELAAIVGVSQQLISRMERGLLDGITAAVIDRAVIALGGRLRVEIGATAPLQVDRDHAALQEWLAATLTRLGWLVVAEHSFNHYGDRGRVDLLAFHPARGILLVFEIKTRVDDVQDLLGRLDVKSRLASQMAEQLGWTPVSPVVTALLLADHRTNHRRIDDHPVLFSRFSLRGQSARGWLQRPDRSRPTGLLLYHGPRQIRPT